MKFLFVILFSIVISNFANASNVVTDEKFGGKEKTGYFNNEVKWSPMTLKHKKFLRDEAKEMFFHAYNSYMDNAYPADELMPLSCKGRYRDSELSRGDIDDALGNFSLTLVDSLDTLVILGEIVEFEKALKLIIRDVTFDHDIVVSVFETNIRMIGGLLSGHLLTDHINQIYGSLGWYRGELLVMAQDLATRLLPAFNTSTGIPHPRVNLKYGMKSPSLLNSRDTCTACAGTIILEFASLSRLTGQPIFEEKARQAMDYLWSQRHRGSDLVGTVLNVHSGDWVRRDSGVGAGIDSYYEYLLKAYVLLGDESYLDRFNKHYNAVMKYVSQGPMLLDVHMHRPHTTSRNFMDALLAFWPGLQVLKGDIKPAIETHEMLYQVIQRHNFLPEAFTTDFQVHWGQHPLRPEFVESTYLLYEATNDPYYLHVGEQVLKSLQKHAWVPCGYAAVKDVRTGAHEDRMDSFVLAETFKYLYLLFAEPDELPININEFIFTTEGHLLPLTLARLSNLTTVPLPEDAKIPLSEEDENDPDIEFAKSCPNAQYLFPGRHQFAENIRKPLKNFVSNICPSKKLMKRKLRASEFQAGSVNHLALLKDMGINIMALPDGRVQLLHTATNSKSAEDAEEGLLFMQEMIELSKLQQDQPENPPRAVSFIKPSNDSEILATITLTAGPAQFGLELNHEIMISSKVVKASPYKACGKLDNAEEAKDRIVILERGECMFIDKARRIEELGAVGGIVIDNVPDTSADFSPMFAMSGDGTDNVSIPLVFLYSKDAEVLLKALEESPDMTLVLSDYSGYSGKGSIVEVDANERNEDSIVQAFQATGPTVRSTLKKHMDEFEEPTCIDDKLKETDEAIENEVILTVEEALNNLDKVHSAQDVLKAAYDYITAQQTQALPREHPSLLSEVQILLLKKTAQNPDLLLSLLTSHIKELINLLMKVVSSPNELESALQLFIEKLSSVGAAKINKVDKNSVYYDLKSVLKENLDKLNVKNLEKAVNVLKKYDSDALKTLLKPLVKKSSSEKDEL